MLNVKGSDRWILAATLVAAANMSSAQEMSDFSGYLSLGWSSTNVNNPGWGDTYNAWQGMAIGAGGTFQLSNGNSIDIEVKSWQALDATEGYDTNGTLAVAGYNWTSGSMVVGGFGGLLSHNDYYGEANDTDLIYGAKLGYAVSEKLTLTAQLGNLSQLNGPYPMGVLTFAEVGAAFALNDALKLSASIGTVNGQMGDDEDETVGAMTYDLGAAYRVNDGPIELYANLSGFSTGDADWGDSQTIGLGFTVSFGGKSMAAGDVMDLSSVSWMRETGSW